MHKSGASDADKVFKARNYTPNPVHSDEKKVGVDITNLRNAGEIGAAGYLRGDWWGNVLRNKAGYEDDDTTRRFIGKGITASRSTYAPFGFNDYFPGIRQERIFPKQSK